jgi:hypothetical protein
MFILELESTASIEVWSNFVKNQEETKPKKAEGRHAMRVIQFLRSRRRSAIAASREAWVCLV